VVNVPTLAGPAGEAGAGFADDCGPRRSGMRTVWGAEDEYLGSLATLTVPARATDPA
jgi:hypothetical protein